MSSSSVPPITIAIPTLNRHDQLAETLVHLSQIDLRLAQEILIIDQTDRPFDLTPFVAQFPIPLRLIHSQIKGLCVARNLALQATTTDLILYLDDDVVPSPELVTQHVQTYADYPQALGVAGAEEIDATAQPSRVKGLIRQGLIWALRPYLRWHSDYRSCLDAAGYPVGLITHTGLFLCDFAHTVGCRVMTARGCNMSFRREALQAIAGFDEGFIGNARREETDACLRLLKAFPDGEIRFNPAARLLHLMSPTGGCRDRKGADWYRQVFTCEFRFARRHLSPLGWRLTGLRLALLHLAAIARHPDLVTLLTNPPLVPVTLTPSSDQVS